jgi:hypothetical protein
MVSNTLTFLLRNEHDGTTTAITIRGHFVVEGKAIALEMIGQRFHCQAMCTVTSVWSQEDIVDIHNDVLNHDRFNLFDVMYNRRLFKKTLQFSPKHYGSSCSQDAVL